ncbi:Uncharacterised protein [Mycobacteroides abscessus subsp. abscessus]|nr:Uncharacterised protein [Mycobacteroides abscessus subsp. abscessus]
MGGFFHWKRIFASAYQAAYPYLIQGGVDGNKILLFHSLYTLTYLK